MAHGEHPGALDALCRDSRERRLVGAGSARGGAIFTLSLPVSRRQLLGVRAATGLAELSVLALVGTLLLPILSPLVGENYAIGDALVHALCLFIASSMLFAFSFFLSTVFSDVWRPVLIVLCVAIVVAFGEQISGLSRYGVYGLMSGETYFRDGVMPWLGLAGKRDRHSRRDERGGRQHRASGF